MGVISEFVAAFQLDFNRYVAIEDEVRVLCKDALQSIVFVWQSRVKKAESLAKKLRDRNDNYNTEDENVRDIVDLIGGRIILVRWEDIQRVENIVSEKFDLRDRVQHPKSAKNWVGFETRFRGYAGLHLQVKRRGPSDHQSCDPVIEIQVMTGFMWTFMELEHDIVYKQSHGKPTKDLELDLEALKALANLGEISLMMYDRHFAADARLSLQKGGINPNFLAGIRTVIDKAGLDDKDKECLRDLRLTDPRHKFEETKDQLLEGSCSWVLEDSAFVDWWTGDDSRLLWIHGDPGKGKTMMMTALISEVSNRLNDRPGPNVLAYFFCENANAKFSTTVSVLRGLIYQLVDHEKMLVRHVREKYDTAGRQLFEDENALVALKSILSDMLRDSDLKNVYFMVDGLDECDPKIHEFLQSIIRRDSEQSPKIKVLTTSRNEQAFIKQPEHGHQLEISLEQNSAHVADAVNKFINYKVKKLADLNSYDSKLKDFVRDSLLEKAEGTFLWVDLVCKELKDVLSASVEDVLNEIPVGLEALYKRMLDQVRIKAGTRYFEYCRQILCSVTFAFRPLRLEEIAVFAKIPTKFLTNALDLKGLVNRCGSFITIREETVFLVHQSAKNYLSDRERKDIFHSGQEQEHGNTARLCLEVMSSTLKKDICDFKTPGICLSDVDESAIGAHIPFHVQYACLYWADHLRQAGPTEQETLVLREVYGFFQDHFLHWLEALSLMSKVSAAVLAIQSLCSIPRARMSSDLSSFVNDARRFILEFRSIIETAPLQLYNSSLVFSPNTSIIKQRFSNELPKWIEKLPIVDEKWTLSLQALEGHSAPVKAVVFSPDGKLLASASDDGTVRLWESATGDLHGTLEGHSAPVRAVVFSPDGKLLASASNDTTVRLWESATGKLHRTLERHSAQVRAVVFSPDGKLLASASDDKTVRLWESATGELQNTLRHFSGWVRAVAFSPDGKLLASVSDYGPVRLWNSATGLLYNTCNYHSWVNAIVFSPKGKLLLASACYTVKLWGLEKGALDATLEGHSGEVSTVVFSPNGKFLASASHDKTVRLWESATRKLHKKLEGHLEWVRAVAFSPDSELLASASNKIVRLWNSATGALCSTLADHSGWVNAIVFSPDGQLLASASDDGTVRLWETVAEASSSTLERHSAWVNAVVFSPDCKLLASASNDTTVRLWESATGKLHRTLEGHSSSARAVTFSPDGKLLASAFYDGTVRLWESATGDFHSRLAGHSAPVRAVVFSPDGKLLASASDDGTVILWDIKENVLKKQIKHEYHGNLSFSTQLEMDGEPLTVSSSSLILSPDALSMNVEGEWVRYKGYNVLWLPPNRRPSSYAFQDKTLVLGSGSGLVTFFQFSTTVTPVLES